MNLNLLVLIMITGLDKQRKTMLGLHGRSWFWFLREPLQPLGGRGSSPSVDVVGWLIVDELL